MPVTAAEEPVAADVVALPWFLGDRPGAFALRRGFTGRVGQVVAEPGADGRSVVLTVGLGRAGEATASVFRRASAAAVRAVGPARTVRLDLALAGGTPVGGAERARAVAEGAALAAYRYGGRGAALTGIVVRTACADEVAEAGAVAGGVRLARDLVNAPPGELTPSVFAERVAALAGGPVTCAVHGVDGLAELGATGVLAVGRGSREAPCLVELRYEPGGAGRAITLVGKGVTFDSGGLSLKPAEAMRSMKADMGGAAAVVGAVVVAAALGLPVRVRALLPLAENMPGGAALRVGDVIRHADGTTTEVLNTDNEGRLLLADALLLARDGEAPDLVVDVATLTGSVAHALGTRGAALFSPDEALAGAVLAAAGRAGEPVWRLPLTESEGRHLRSAVADRANGSHRPGGAIHAALYLRAFTSPDVPWAHLDLGDAAFNEEPSYDEIPHGATGFGVRTLVELLRRA
ncbi:MULTISPECIES: M17 family peptidase N-terminal domain-containing protein [Actinosynnema]|uniref:leucyl aminopeptidase family protein n=1 Tax=Actinosynnema TaxID=40566 RepID=UPI0020A27240|nr:M17 family peptidase N-terminal domain-containing protein [Actinosynnema pretiosum]